MARKSTAPGSKRPHAAVRRQLRLTVSFTEEELEAIRAAAKAAGMEPGAWLAKTGTDAAAASVGAAPPSTAADVVDSMESARKTAAKIGYLFDQAVAKLHSTGQHSPDLEASAAAVARAVRRMEAATLRAARELLR